MVVAVLAFTHPERCLRSLWPYFCRRLRALALLKLWRHLVLTFIKLLWASHILCLLAAAVGRQPMVYLVSPYMRTWPSVLSSVLIYHLSSLRNLFWSRPWAGAIVERVLMCITRLVWALFVGHNPWVVTSWLSIGQLILLISRAIGWSLFRRLIRRYRDTMASMSVIDIRTRAWLLLFVTSTIFGWLTSLVRVHGAMVSIRHRTGWRRVLGILRCLLVLEECVVAWRVASSVQLLLVP